MWNMRDMTYFFKMGGSGTKGKWVGLKIGGNIPLPTMLFNLHLHLHIYTVLL